MDFAKAASWLSSQRQACGAVPVIYRRGASQALALDAKPTVVKVELADASGAKIESQRTDWIIEATDLIFGGVLSAPQEGDQIEVSERDGVTRTYEAMPHGTDSHFTILMDRAGFIVHTKLVGEP